MCIYNLAIHIFWYIQIPFFIGSSQDYRHASEECSSAFELYCVHSFVSTL